MRCDSPLSNATVASAVAIPAIQHRASSHVGAARFNAHWGVRGALPFARLVAMVASTALLVGCDRTGEATMRGIAMTPPRVLPAFSFVRANGEPFTTTSERGNFTVLFFGYTKCPDICPATLADWKRVKSALGDDGARVRFVFISVDPVRDSARVAQAYVARFDSSFIGLTADAATTSNMQTALGATSDNGAMSHAGGYMVAHSTETYLLDSAGRLLAVYRQDVGWDALAVDLESLL